MLANIAEIENHLWATADQLWANSGLKPSEYSVPVLGLLFLRHAEHRFNAAAAASAKPTIRPAACCGWTCPISTSACPRLLDQSLDPYLTYE